IRNLSLLATLFMLAPIYVQAGEQSTPAVSPTATIVNTNSSTPGNTPTTTPTTTPATTPATTSATTDIPSNADKRIKSGFSKSHDLNEMSTKRVPSTHNITTNFLESDATSNHNVTSSHNLQEITTENNLNETTTTRSLQDKTTTNNFYNISTKQDQQETIKPNGHTQTSDRYTQSLQYISTINWKSVRNSHLLKTGKAIINQEDGSSSFQDKEVLLELHSVAVLQENMSTTLAIDAALCVSVIDSFKEDFV
ncbi:hypothetical protein OTU49_014626, partial [Cherax quadricarinatus]